MTAVPSMAAPAPAAAAFAPAGLAPAAAPAFVAAAPCPAAPNAAAPADAPTADAPTATAHTANASNASAPNAGAPNAGAPNAAALAVAAAPSASAHRPLVLRQLTPDAAAAERALSVRTGMVALSVGPAKLLAVLAPVTGPAVSSAPGDPAAPVPGHGPADPWLTFTIAGAPGAVQMPRRVAERLVGAALAGAAEDVALLLENAVADWLDLFEQEGGPSLRLVAFGMDAAPTRVGMDAAARGVSTEHDSGGAGSARGAADGAAARATDAAAAHGADDGGAGGVDGGGVNGGGENGGGAGVGGASVGGASVGGGDGRGAGDGGLAWRTTAAGTTAAGAAAAGGLPVRRVLEMRGQTLGGAFWQQRLPLALSLGAAATLARHMARLPGEPLRLHHLPMTLTVEIGCAVLTPSELASLRPGDGIRLPDRDAIDGAARADEAHGVKDAGGANEADGAKGAEGDKGAGPGALVLRLGPHLCARARPAPAGLRLLTRFGPAAEIWTPLERTPPMPPDAPTSQATGAPPAPTETTAPATQAAPSGGTEAAAAAPPAAATQGPSGSPAVAVEAADLDRLDIALSFRIAAGTVPLGELKTLAPGAILPIAGAPDATVEIWAHGRRIGTGEVVAIGPGRAVQIVSLATDG